MSKIIYIAPHLSTGGLPQYLYKKAEIMSQENEVYVLEHSNHSDHFVVQKTRLKELLGDRFRTIGSDKMEIFREIQRIQPDVVHLEEIPEYFLELDVAEAIYHKDRKYKIFETSHDSSYNTDSKVFLPDAFLLVSNYQISNFKKLGIPCHLVEYPIEYVENKISREEALAKLGLDPNFKHVINVGLFTPRKNQAEIIGYARELKEFPIKFHFIGNQADNFASYWEPLMKDLPENCVIWGERNDVSSFYEAADLFLFTSRGNANDKETSPLVIREAISWRVPSLIYNLPVYLGMYDDYQNIKFLQPDKEQNKTLILESLGLTGKQESEDSKKKIFIIDAFAKTEDKRKLLVECIKSIREFGCDIMLVSHCTLPESIISLVDFHLYDADNTFNNNHVFGYNKKNGIEVRKFIHKSHEYPIVRAMRLATSAAKRMGYDFFYLTEFDHVYSKEDIKEIKRLEAELTQKENNFLFFQPERAQFGEIVGQYYETCFFGGYLDRFTEKFEEFFPNSIEEYNNSLAVRFPNCLEHFFWSIFKDEKNLIVKEYVKSYFSSSMINVSSYQDTDIKVLLDEEESPYLVIHNNNNQEFRYYIDLEGERKEYKIKGDLEIIPLETEGEITVEEYREEFCKKYLLSYYKKDSEEYKKQGTIIVTDKNLIKKSEKKMFKITYLEEENKLDFTYQLDQPQKIRVSIKDIDSRACIYSFESEFSKGSGIWTIPLPTSEIHFKNDPMFGGFLMEYRKDGEIVGKDEIRIKEIPTVKKIADFSDTEPIFMNYCEFFEEKIYDRFDVQNLKVVFDIGASVGLWTNYILSQGAKKVYSFEPNRVALDHIRKNFENEPRVTIIPNAVYYKKSTIPFYVDPSNSLISSVLQETNNAPTYEVETVILDDIMDSNGIDKVDLIKMDIEGAEFDIFENITEKTISRVDSWLIEYHDFYFDDGTSKIDFLIKKLEDFGYRVSRPDGYRFIFASKVKKNYWVDVDDSTQIRNLYDFSKTFSWENMNKGIQNGYHHAFNEMNFYFDQYTNGCIYERYGCVINKGDVVVDVGANVGIFTNAAYHKGAGRIISFEPGDLAFRLLEMNKPEGCETFKMGISYAKGFYNFSLPSKNDTMSGSFSESSPGIPQIYCLSINDLFSSGLVDKIDFLKIDAEGAEWKILQGISDENLSKISKVSLEFHANYLSDGVSQRIMNRMTNAGFNTFQLFLGDGTLRIYNFWK